MTDLAIGVLHLVDSLSIGGTERVAINLVNHLPRNRYRLYLCTTRCEGPLAAEVAADVGRLALGRRHTLDIAGIRRLVAFIQRHSIQLLHAHSSTLFVAAVASLFPPFPRVVWHDHYGRYAMMDRPIQPYWLLTRRIGGTIAVSQPLADWSRRALHLPSKQVWYIPNFVCLPEAGTAPNNLPGTAGSRIICVANLRLEKDHLALLRAMALVVREAPKAHLLLVGASGDTTYRDYLLAELARLGLGQHVTWLGQRRDVAAILGSSEIGVLSSASEGMPLALIEYGMAGLPVVATRVGQCAEVLNDGQAGLLVPPGSSEDLATALLQLLESPEQRAILGDRLRRRVQAIYNAEAIIGQICSVYDRILHAQGRSVALDTAPPTG
jgi:glycosyltransferase involved in cell wall biosynthesis